MNQRSYRSTFKRCLDLAFVVLLLPGLLPLGLVIALLIKLGSRGPALIRLKRLGQSGSTIYQYKFRTMVVNAEKVLEELLSVNEEIRKEYMTTYTIKRGPRVTRLGRLLRKISLDEIPQVLNILFGEMSWVGPRPILHRELAMYGDSAEKILTVKPGLTGLWQVSGRSRLPYREKVLLDVYYVHHLSLFLDLKIITGTIPAVLFGDGAV